MLNRIRPFASPLLSVLIVWTLTGCTASHYKKSADREVFKILKSKSKFVPGSEDDTLLDITPPPPVELAALEREMKPADFLGSRAFIERDARVVSLEAALGFAVHRNRQYLAAKERVYLSALDLTLTRQRFGPVLDGAGNVDFTERQVASGVNNFVRTSTLAGGSSLAFDYLAKTGARLAMDLTTDVTRFLTGGVRRLADSQAAVTLTQPLLRGAGVLAAAEPLRQDERAVLYEIRDFTQYRKQFAVDISRQYFRILQAREQARNRYLAYQASLRSIERDRALAAANLRSQSSLKQVEQSQITYERSWVTAISSYEEQLDSLKIALGLPVNERIILDPRELQRLEVIDPQGTVDEVMDVALVTRLDVYNDRDRVHDRIRRVKIAHQNTLPGIDAVATYEVNSLPRSTRPSLNLGDRRIGAGLDIDLNLNTKPERNALREEQIAEQRARRDLELVEEQLRETIRSDWRQLEVARRQYELAQKGMSLAQQRLEIEQALMEEGQGTARDIVEAQDRMITARDLVVSTLIDHTIARLRLWADMGILFIKKDGTWADVLKNERPKGDS